MAKSQQFNIVEGPSKWDLMLSLFDGTTSNRRPVSFRTDRPLMMDRLTPQSINLIEIKVNALSREDGSDDSWNFSGFVTNSPKRAVAKGYFSTKTRKGSIDVTLME